jgi:hypothetical protein
MFTGALLCTDKKTSVRDSRTAHARTHETRTAHARAHETRTAHARARLSYSSTRFQLSYYL